MSYNWNVYKIFKNGKRAKAPLTVFECEENEVEQHFQSEFKLDLDSCSDKYKVIRSDLPQERESEVVDKEQQMREKIKSRVLSNLVRQNNIPIPKNRTVGAALIYSSDSNWQRQWAAIEKGTSNYIQGLSPTFKTHAEAETWIENLISSKM